VERAVIGGLGDTLTNRDIGVILDTDRDPLQRSHLALCDDGLIAWIYWKDRQKHRRTLFEVLDNNAVYMDPVSKEKFVIGKVIHLEEGPLIVAFLV